MPKLTTNVTNETPQTDQGTTSPDTRIATDTRAKIELIEEDLKKVSGGVTAPRDSHSGLA
jgi:hypothetical protein